MTWEDIFHIKLSVQERKHKRIILLGRVDIQDEQREVVLNGYAINVSKGGVAIYIDKPFDINTRLSLTIFFREELSEKGETVQGRVRWIKPVGDLYAMGLQFIEVSKETHPLIFSYIETSIKSS